jgi:cell division protein FtsB
MNPRGNPAPLAEARRRHSLDKRARVLTVLATLEKQGKPLTFAAVARAARVSTWLTYASGVREHIEAAQLRQAHSTPPSAATASPPSALSLRTELEIARQEIKDLRDERDRLQAALRHQLGYQLDAIHAADAADAATRADELTARNQDLTRQLQEASAENVTCRARITALEDDLTAARTSLRRMIRDENLR